MVLTLEVVLHRVVVVVARLRLVPQPLVPLLHKVMVVLVHQTLLLAQQSLTQVVVERARM
jgi:hypothetical protein